MSFKDTSSARWRGRAIAVAGIAAAATVGGLALATAAQAAPPPPTLTLNAPTTVLNNTSPASTPFVIDVNNIGGAAIPTGTSATLGLTMTVPVGLNCTNVLLIPLVPSPNTASVALSPALGAVSGGTSGTCTWAPVTLTQAANSDEGYSYLMAVNGPGFSGTLHSTATFDATDSAGNHAYTLTSSDDTTLTAAAASGAAVFSTTPVPAATIYKPFRFKLATSVGSPTSNWCAFGSPTQPNSAGIYGTPVTECASAAAATQRGGSYTNAGTTVPNPDGVSSDLALPLDDDFFFDTVTGDVVWWDGTDNAPNFTDWQPAHKWTILANNLQGGAATASSGVPVGATVPSTPNILVHDVASPAFTDPVLFSDVAATNVFAKPIYTLAHAGTINGFADGTYRPTMPITRSTFAAILARQILGGYGASAPCSFFNPSAFPDVPNDTPLCSEIRDLAKQGIIKGFADGNFHPDALITRGAVAALLYRAHAFAVGATVGDATCTTAPFNDVAVNYVFCGDIAWMKSNGYSNGFADGGYHPNASTLRQETAAFIYRIFVA